MLIDTHAHLEMREFNDDREEVIKRAREAGVEVVEHDTVRLPADVQEGET